MFSQPQASLDCSLLITVISALVICLLVKREASTSTYSQSYVFQAGGQDCVCGGSQFGESGVWPGNPGEGLVHSFIVKGTQVLK